MTLIAPNPTTAPRVEFEPQARLSRRLKFLACAMLFLVAVDAGCQSYQLLDLAQQDAAPTSLSSAAAGLRERAVALRNPLLRPIEVDPTDGYTPEELAVAAVVLNPTLRAARGRVAVVDAQASQAAMLPNPALAFGLDVPIGSNTSGEVAGYGLSVEWEITSLLTHGAKVQAATQTAAQGRLDTAWQEWQVAEAARQATYDVLVLRRQCAATRLLGEQLDRVASDADRALQRHDVNATDAAAATAAAGEAHIALAAAERELVDAELALRRAIGIAADEAFPLNESVQLPMHIAVPDAAVLTEHLADHRIDLVALRRGYDSQEAAVRGAILGQFPKISLGISHTRDTGDFLTLGPALTIELPVFDRNQGVITIERATRQQLFDEYHTRTFEARSDVARAVAAVRAINTQIGVVAGQVKTLQDLVSADQQALQRGDLDVTSYYTAAVSLSQRQADLAKLQQDLMHGLITLELAAGVYLPVGN